MYYYGGCDKISVYKLHAIRGDFMTTYRIHGDNIVECERIANILINTLNPITIYSYLVYPSTIAIEITADFCGKSIEWKLELLPGFNKSTKTRWGGNIFDSLKEAGSFLDETPDVIISEVNEDEEQVLLGIEFCSALQAGNQAWQRSGRAFSTGRTGCPYLYIVDFVKYELNNSNRKRKNLRFPNSAVPYSYVNYSKITGNFVAQLYTKSEEFDKQRDPSIENFDEENFGSENLGIYIIKLMLKMDTSTEERLILAKNMNVVQFLADRLDSRSNFTASEWNEVHKLSSSDIVDYSVDKDRFNFHKTIAAKSHHGKSKEIVELVDQLSIGLAARDLPFGIIPATKRRNFADKILQFYPNFDHSIIDALGSDKKHLIIAIFKGFKPKGDDNRPDRGVLSLAAMLSATDVDVITYIYGPVHKANLNLLDNNPVALANKNGLWRSILALSSYVLLDVPVLSNNPYDAERLYDTRKTQEYYSKLGITNGLKPKPYFASIPINFGEDDVDTGIHYFFSHVLGKYCFEGMCNPPGGDWSGFSVINGEFENRWLSLPRVSDVVNGKRPDHIIEIFGVFPKPLLLSIESKEKSVDLESDVGTKLVTYIEKLMDYVPSAKRKVLPDTGEWQWGDNKIVFNDFEIISAAAYLKKYAEPSHIVFKKNCEMLFIMDPIIDKANICWQIEIIPSSERSKLVKRYIIDKYKESEDQQFILK